MKGKSVCTHSQVETAYQCGFRSNICSWTKSTVKDGGRIVERLLEKEVQICELMNNDGEETFGVHCCDTEKGSSSTRRFLRRRR